MPTQRVIIELSPSRVEVATLKGDAPVEWRCERFNRAEWPSPYTTALPEVTNTLTKILTDMGIKGGAATVIYCAPGSVTGLTSCAANLGLASAEQAALLSLANVADFPLDDAPSDTCVLMVEKGSKGTKDAPAPPAQRHIVAVAEAEQRTAAISAAIESVGLHVDRLIPSESISIADALRRATADTSDESVGAVLWIGEHSSNLAVGNGGRLLFVRTITVGTENLTEVLCRPLRPREPEAQPITLAHDAARTLLLSAGIPTVDSTIPNYPTLAGSSLLPHLQPVLQRLAIEVKQSLRFGVPEAERPRLLIRLAGPGAAVPGLGEAIARLSGFNLAPPGDVADTPDALDSSTGGLIAALSHCPKLTLTLMSAEARTVWKIRRARKALIAGAALALAYVAYEAGDTQWKLRTETANLTRITSAAQTAEGPLALRQQAMTARLNLSDVERRLRKALEQSPDWAAVMGVIAEKTPPEIRLQMMEMSRDSGKPGLIMHAIVRLDEAKDPAGLIQSYVNALESVPLINAVRLGGTQRTMLASHDSQKFDLTLSIVSLPHAAAAAKLPALTAHNPEGK